jgi:hypothetical protein
MKKLNLILMSVLTIFVLTVSSTNSETFANKSDKYNINPEPGPWVATDPNDFRENKNLKLTEKQKRNVEIERLYLEDINSILENILGEVDKIGEYGSFYIEPYEDYKFVLGLAKEDLKTDKLKQELKQVIPSNLFKIKKMKKSVKDLEIIQSNINEFLVNQGYDNFGITVDVYKEKLILNIDSISSDTEDQLSTLFGEYIEIETGISLNYLLSRDANFGTLGGGIAIQSSNCSTAATATKNGVAFIVTAGHCTDGDGKPMYQNNNWVGSDHYDLDNATDRLDVGLIKIQDTRYISNYFLNNEGSSSWDSRHTGVGSATLGSTACKSGITTNTTCGEIVSVNSSGTVEGKYYDNLIRLDSANDSYPIALPGDSGSIVFTASTNKIIGLVSHGMDGEPYNRVWCPKMTEIESRLSSSTAPFRIYSSNTALLVN